jgi:hypothetical protein
LNCYRPTVSAESRKFLHSIKSYLIRNQLIFQLENLLLSSTHLAIPLFALFQFRTRAMNRKIYTNGKSKSVQWQKGHLGVSEREREKERESE